MGKRRAFRLEGHSRAHYRLPRGVCRFLADMVMTMPELEERIAVLETNQQFIKEQLAEMNESVREMHSLLLQAKGARWVIIGVASLAGFLSAKFGGLMALFGAKM